MAFVTPFIPSGSITDVCSRSSAAPSLQPSRKPLAGGSKRNLRMSVDDHVSRRDIMAAVAMGALGLGLAPKEAKAGKPEGVNRPELLPPGEVQYILDLEKFLTSGQEAQLLKDIQRVENEKGIKIRVLTQRYPQTPGYAIKDYWKLDDKSIVMVADFFGGSGNLLKFNVGDKVYDVLPPRFWSLLASEYGNMFFVKKNGEDQAILQSIKRITDCILIKGMCKTPSD